MKRVRLSDLTYKKNINDVTTQKQFIPVMIPNTYIHIHARICAVTEKLILTDAR